MYRLKYQKYKSKYLLLKRVATTLENQKGGVPCIDELQKSDLKTLSEIPLDEIISTIRTKIVNNKLINDKNLNDIFDLDKKTVLGAGAFGSTFLVTVKKPFDTLKTGDKVVIKNILDSNFLSSDKITEYEVIGLMLAQLSGCKNIPHIHGFVKKGLHNAPTIIMEFIGGLNMEKYVVNNKMSVRNADDLNKVAHWFTQLNDTLKCLHSDGIAHRDIKPDNIMIRDNDAIFIDFGLSCKQGTMCNPVSATKYRSPIKAYNGTDIDMNIERANDKYSLGLSILNVLAIMNPNKLAPFSEQAMHFREYPELLKQYILSFGKKFADVPAVHRLLDQACSLIRDGLPEVFRSRFDAINVSSFEYEDAPLILCRKKGDISCSHLKSTSSRSASVRTEPLVSHVHSEVKELDHRNTNSTDGSVNKLVTHNQSDLKSRYSTVDQLIVKNKNAN
jgi:serine/threonine protein kinase